MVERARERAPASSASSASPARQLELGETFDYIVLSDLMPFVDDLLALFQRVAAHSHERTRIVVNSYSRAWRPVVQARGAAAPEAAQADAQLGRAARRRNLLELAGFETVLTPTRILFPKQIPLLTTFLNGFLGSIWPLQPARLTYWIVARPLPRELDESSVSIVCPCRNEQGTSPS